MTSSLPPDESLLRTAADRVFEALQAAIVRGDIAPGSRVGEAELAERFGTSRGPLREALRRLESRRLVERTPHVGIRIASLGAAELIEIYYVREALEGMAARLAAMNMTAAEVAGLRELLAEHQRDEALQADTAYFQQEGDLDFHYRIIQGSHNQALTQLLIGELYYRVRMYRYQFSGYTNRPQKAFAEHQRIVEAIEARDGDLAEMLMRRHVSTARQNIEKHLAAPAAPPAGAAQAAPPVGAAQAAPPVGAAQAAPPVGAAQAATNSEEDRALRRSYKSPRPPRPEESR